MKAKLAQDAYRSDDHWGGKKNSDFFNEREASCIWPIADKGVKFCILIGSRGDVIHHRFRHPSNVMPCYSPVRIQRGENSSKGGFIS